MAMSSMADAPIMDATEFQSGRGVPSLRARFAKDALVFGWASIISLLINSTLTFLLPRYLTVEDFGYYRLFVLYANLTGLVHLGFLEGVLVRWAEKPEERVGSELKNVLAFIVAQHCAILVPFSLAVLVWFPSPPHLLLGIALAIFVLVYNCALVGQIALQSRKQFKQLSFFTVVTAASLFALVLLCKLLGRLDSVTAICSYIAANLVAGFGVWRAALKPAAARMGTFSDIRRIGRDNIRLGWKILAASLLLTVIPNLDRFFVSGAFSIQKFAIYAFAGNALGIVYTVSLSVSRVVYPYLSEGTNVEARRRAYSLGQVTVLALWALSLTLYFPTAFLVHWIIPKYVDSLPIVRLLMINAPFVCMIHILHANYFRVNLALNRFLTGSVIGLMVTAVLLTVAKGTGSLQRIAGAMTIAVVIWWFVNEWLLAAQVGGSWMDRSRVVLLWFLCSAAFMAAATISNLWAGGTAYLVACSFVLLIGLKNTLAPLFARNLSVAAP